MPPSRFPFHELPNVVMSPHRAGAAGVGESETRRMEALAALINDGWQGGKEGGKEGGAMRNRVWVDRGY
jgi:phosphoglycerate dehydrogenase-like enzyme